MFITIWAPGPSGCKDNSKFEILLAKIFSIRQKANQILSATLRKIKFVSSKKQPKNITMKKFKAKVIQADEGIFTHILVYSDIFKHKKTISIFRTLCNPGLFRTLAYTEQKPYSEPWYIENRDIFRTLVYSEPWHI